jgi:radical SAM protein with 4Fe4S-binding SPASM domain
VLLQGLGEPLLYRGLLPLIERLKARMGPDSEIGLTTNATLLDEKAALRLIASGIDFVYFSVDAATPESYAAIRVGGDFHEVVGNIERFARLRGGGKPRLMMNFVVTGQNAREIPAFVRLTARLGVERVTFSRYLDQESGAIGSCPEEQLEQYFSEAAAEAGRTGIAIDFPPTRRVAEERCAFMERMVVLGSGDVVPCHAMAPGYCAREKARVFGNLREKGVREVWDQRDFREFRLRVLTGDFPGECSGCMCKAFLVP